MRAGSKTVTSAQEPSAQHAAIGEPERGGRRRPSSCGWRPAGSAGRGRGRRCRADARECRTNADAACPGWSRPRSRARWRRSRPAPTASPVISCTSRSFIDVIRIRVAPAIGDQEVADGVQRIDAPSPRDLAQRAARILEAGAARSRRAPTSQDGMRPKLVRPSRAMSARIRARVSARPSRSSMAGTPPSTTQRGAGSGADWSRCRTGRRRSRPAARARARRRSRRASGGHRPSCRRPRASGARSARERRSPPATAIASRTASST